MRVPIFLIIGDNFSKHSVQCEMKALNAAVGLRVVWSRVQLVDLQKLADFTEQFRTEFRPVVDKKPARCAPSGKDLIDQNLRDGRGCVIPDGKCFGPFREIIDDGNHVFIATGRLGMRSRYVHGNHLKRVLAAKRRKLSLFWRFSTTILRALLTSFQLNLNLTFPARPVGSLSHLLLCLVSTKMASCHAAVYNPDELGPVLTW